MRHLPWHVAARPDRRAILTALGVALGVCFSAVGIAIPLALEQGVAEAPTFTEGDALVSAGHAFDPTPLGLVGTRVLIVPVTLADGTFVTLAAIDGAGAPPIDVGTVHAQEGTPPLARTLIANGTALTRGADLRVDVLPRSWALITPQDARAIDPRLAEGRVSYLVASAMGDARAHELRAQGYDVRPVPAVRAFFADSTSEIGIDLVLIVIFTSILVALFVYEFLRTEIHERRREIGLWRAVGMRGGDVLALLMARSLAIAAGGFIAGAVVASFLLQLMERSLAGVASVLSGRAWALIAAATLLAGAMGGLVPALASATRRPRELLEGAP